jgi:FkbM family methyltransferase
MSTHHEQLRQIVNVALLRPGLSFLDETLRKLKPGFVVIDVGTNEGGFTNHWLQQGASTVHAFEPVPAVFARLHANFGTNRNVILNNLAVSDRKSVVRGVQILGAHTLADPRVAKMDIALEDTGPFDMETTTLDSYAAALPRVDFIKLDVDGYEFHALRGMAGVLAKHRPPMMIELSFLPRKLGESCESMIDWIYAAGYKLCTMTGEVCEDPLFVLEGFPWRTSFDMIAVPNEQIGNWPRIR